MKMLKELILGLCLVSTAASAGQDDVITRLAIENAFIKPEQEKGVVFFEIELLTDKGNRKVIVDLQSGKPIPVASKY